MNIAQRRDRILSLLDENDYLTADDAARMLDTSPATIRRDFQYLEDADEVVKFYGGIKRKQTQINCVTSYEERLLTNKDEKLSIAKAAAELIEDDDLIFLDASTTVYYMIQYIKAKNLQIVTNSFYLVPKLIEYGFTPYMLTGHSEPHGYVYGEETITQIMSMSFSKCFLGASGVNHDRGLVTYSIKDGNLKKSVIRQSRQAYSLADTTKFEKDSYYCYASPTDSTLITTKENEYADRYESILLV